jgi:PAS domain S-box-containing protein
MAKTSTRLRIRLAMLTVFVIMLFTCFFLTYQIYSVHKNTTVLYEHPYRVSRCVNLIKIELYKKAGLYQSLRYESDPVKRDLLQKANTDASVTVDSLFRIISDYYLGNKIDVLQSGSAFSGWESAMEAYNSIPPERLNDSLTLRMDNKARVFFNRLLEDLNGIYSFADRKAKSTYDNSSQKEIRSYWLSAFILGSSIILVIFLIFYLTKSISRPIHRFIEEANRILRRTEKIKNLADEEMMMATLAELKDAYRKIEHQKQEIEQWNLQLSLLNEELEDTVRDRTAQLKKSNDYLESLFHYANAPIIVWNHDFIITRFNPAFEDLTGHKASEVLGKSVAILFPSEKADASMSLLKETFEGKQLQVEEIEIAHKDGSVRTVLWNSATVEEDGLSVAAIAQGQDISKRVLLEKSLKIQNQISQVFLTCPDDSMYQEVLKLVLHEMNSPFGAFGYIDEEGAWVIPSMKGHVMDECKIQDKTIRFPREKWTNTSWARAFREMRPNYSNEISFRIPIGHAEIRRHIAFPIIMHSQVIALLLVANKASDYSNEDVIFLETIANIIAPVLDARIKHDQYEKQRSEMLAALERSNKELEQFAYIASHDLQEPLRMISSYTQLLSRRYKGRLDSDADDFIEYATGGAERMQKLINDLLEYSRLNTRKSPMALVNCHQVLGYVRSNLSIMLEDEHAVLTCDELPVVVGDETQLVQLFQNLISNAVKYHREIPPHVHVSAKELENEWVFSVRDNGIGIQSEFFERIFGIFQRLHSRYEYSGTGIGLAICKKIVERHGGTIWLESVPGEGSTFYFSLSKYQ